jgi:hypothetical protein
VEEMDGWDWKARAMDFKEEETRYSWKLCSGFVLIMTEQTIIPNFQGSAHARLPPCPRCHYVRLCGRTCKTFFSTHAPFPRDHLIRLRSGGGNSFDASTACAAPRGAVQTTLWKRFCSAGARQQRAESTPRTPGHVQATSDGCTHAHHAGRFPPDSSLGHLSNRPGPAVGSAASDRPCGEEGWYTSAAGSTGSVGEPRAKAEGSHGELVNYFTFKGKATRKGPAGGSKLQTEGRVGDTMGGDV